MTDISAKQFLKYDELDFDIVKILSLGSCFLFKPFFGAIVTKIDQKLTLNSLLLFDNFSATQQTKLTNNFKGGGLQIGFDMEYTPFCWLTFYGIGSYSLLWGKFHLKRTDFFVGGDPLNVEIPRSGSSIVKSVVQAMDINAGIKLGTSFCKDAFRIFGYLGYEFVYYPNQVSIPKILSQAVETFILLGNGNIGFNGITTGLLLEF